MSQALFVPHAFPVPVKLQSNSRIAGCIRHPTVRHLHGIRHDYCPSYLGRPLAFNLLLILAGRRATRRKVARAQAEKHELAEKQDRKWFMLLAVSLCSACNAFLCMTFSVIEHLSAEALSISTLQVAGLYTIWLVTTFIGLTPGTYMTDTSEGFAITWSALFNVTSAVVRSYGAQQGSYQLIVASQILCGAGAWPIFTLPSKISHRLFPVHQKALATSIMLQANYAGWLLGVIFPSLLSMASFGQISAQQAVVSMVACATALVALKIGRRSPGPSGTPRTSKSDQESGFTELIQAMLTHPKLAVQILAHGTLGGVSFAAPSAIFFILDNFGFSSSAASAVNIGFIASGLLAGILLGRFCKSRESFGKALAACYSTCLASLMLCAVLAAKGILRGSSGWGLWVLLVLCTMSGGSSLGFIGIGIEATSLYPVRSSFLSWGIEMVVLGTAAILSYYAAGRSGFLVLAAVTAACTLAHFSSYQNNKRFAKS